MEVSDQLHAPAALPPGINPGTQWIGGCIDHRAGVDVLKREKSFAPNEIRTPDRVVRVEATRNLNTEIAYWILAGQILVAVI